jgi:hypothetical protein
MDDLDPTVAERILGEYPELLNYWRREMTNPDREEKYGVGGVRRMHNPAYLQKVVYQHRWLTDGPGDRPDPKLARRCEEIVATCPEYRDERARALSDPWTRAIFDSYWIVVSTTLSNLLRTSPFA